jgi:hypothetical protein
MAFKKQIPLFSLVFWALALLAFYLAEQTHYRGGGRAMLIVLLFAFILFWRRSLRSS